MPVSLGGGSPPWLSHVMRGSGHGGASKVSEPMVRFYFHTRNGHDHHDVEGTDLPTASEVRREAMAAIGAILCDGTEEIADHWQMRVEDGAGKTVLTVVIRVDEAPN